MTYTYEDTLHKDNVLSLNSVFQYYAMGTGPLSTTSIEAMAFFDSGIDGDLKSPDLQLNFLEVFPTRWVRNWVWMKIN